MNKLQLTRRQRYAANLSANNFFFLSEWSISKCKNDRTETLLELTEQGIQKEMFLKWWKAFSINWKGCPVEVELIASNVNRFIPI